MDQVRLKVTLLAVQNGLIQLVFHPLCQAMHLRKLQKLRAAGALLRHWRQKLGQHRAKILADFVVLWQPAAKPPMDALLQLTDTKGQLLTVCKCLL